MDYCELIAAIGRDPSKIVSGLKVRDFLLMKQHYNECDKCAAIVDDVVENYKPKDDKWSMN